MEILNGNKERMQAVTHASTRKDKLDHIPSCIHNNSHTHIKKNNQILRKEKGKV